MDYRLLDNDSRRDTLEAQIRSLELEHFGLTRNLSTVEHAVLLQEGETPEQGLARFRRTRIPEVEAQLDELHREFDAMSQPD